MWNIKHTYPLNKGFTLIEVILALAIISMIILPLFSILDFSIKACTAGEQTDELMLNGRYAIEYIKNEIKSADKIISSDKIEGLKAKYPTNIGFVIMISDIGETGKILSHNYITYHTKNDILVRIARSVEGEKYPSANYLSGYNDICELVEGIGNTKFTPEQSIISLDFKFKHESGKNLELKTDIYIRCPIDY